MNVLVDLLDGSTFFMKYSQVKQEKLQQKVETKLLLLHLVQ